ncbi:14599_t:CDS:2 [Rhizophagus irregularis]|nr:14599_t:CDS:2 [Rhizophagus irregularis]
MSEHLSQNLAAPVPDVPEPAKTDDSAAKISGIALFKRTTWCRPFIKPVDETSCIYRNIITPLMDLTTVEHNLWAGKYDVESFKFYDDLFIMHSNSIHNIQRSRFDAYVFFQFNNGISKPPHDLNKLDFALAQIGAKLPMKNLLMFVE